MPLRAVISVFLCVLLAVPAPLWAEGSGTPAPTAGSTGRGEPPKDVPSSGSLEQFLQLQKLAELADDPDWLLLLAGVMVAAIGGQRLTGDLSVLGSKTLPSAVRLRRLSQALKLGDQHTREFERLAGELQPLAQHLKTSAATLEQHLLKLPGSTPFRSRIHGQTPDEVHRQLSQPEVRDAIAATERGAVWLREYEMQRQEYLAAQEAVGNRFNSSIERLQSFSGRVNELGEGYFRMEDLAHRPIVGKLIPTPFGKPGSMTMQTDSGFNIHIEEPNQIPLFAHTPKVRCSDLMAWLRRAKDRTKVELHMSVFIKPVIHGGAVAAGVGLYQWGAKRIRDATQTDPQALIEEARNRAQVDVVREANRSTEMTALVEQLRAVRGEKGDADMREVYRIFREAIRAELPDMAQSIRERTDATLRDKAEFEQNLWRFMTKDDEANAILDSALAEAALTELKVSGSESILPMLLSRDASSEPQQNRLLMRHYGSVLRYLWPKMTVEGTTLPVDASHIVDAVNSTGPRLRRLSENRQQRVTPPATGSVNPPVKPAGSTTAVPGPGTSPSDALTEPAPPPRVSSMDSTQGSLADAR